MIIQKIEYVLKILVANYKILILLLNAVNERQLFANIIFWMFIIGACTLVIYIVCIIIYY